MKRKQVLQEAINKYGNDNQKRMAIEECAELINALCKEKRGRNTDDDVITEIADVTIMCQQLTLIYGEEKVREEINRKVRRLKQRMGCGKEDK